MVERLGWRLAKLCRARRGRVLRIGTRTFAPNPWRGKCFECGVIVLPKAGVQAIAVHTGTQLYTTVCLKCVGVFLDEQVARAAQ